MKQIKSYTEILSTINTLSVQNKEIKKANKRQNELLKPKNLLVILEDLAIFPVTEEMLFNQQLDLCKQ